MSLDKLSSLTCLFLVSSAILCLLFPLFFHLLASQLPPFLVIVNGNADRAVCYSPFYESIRSVLDAIYVGKFYTLDFRPALDSREVRVPEVRAAEVCSGEVRSLEVYLGEVRTRKTCFDEVSVFEVRIGEVYLGELRESEVCPDEVRSPEAR